MLSWLASDFFARSPVLAYPLVALFVFFAVFAGASLKAVLTRRSEIDRLARLPFSDDTTSSTHPDAPAQPVEGPRS